jgi:hypothetical protein
MTREEYIGHLRAIYLVANNSDNEDKENWLLGNECSFHCRAYDTVVHHMGLDDNWLEE